MRKVIVQEFVTLDNFGADINGEYPFMPGDYNEHGADTSMEQHQSQFVDSIDTMLLGRKTYQLFAEYWPEATADKDVLADKLNALQKVVFSSTLDSAPWGKWEAAKVAKGKPADEIAQLKQQSGKNIVVWGSLSLVQSLVQEGLVDEYVFMIAPLALGAGKKIFPDAKQPLHLKLLETKTFSSGMVMMRYEAVK